MSTKRRAPHYSFRGRELFGAVDESSRLVNNPGPGAYGRTPVQGKNAPAYSLGVRAEKGKRRSSTPGPGMPLQRMVCAGGRVLTPRVRVCVSCGVNTGRYKGPSSFGRQVESTIRSHAGVAFQMSKRPPLLQNQTAIGPGALARPAILCLPTAAHPVPRPC